MELRRIEQKKVLAAWHRHVQELNQQQKPVAHTRRVGDTVQTYITRPKAITGSVAATGTRLIMDYLACYYKVQNNPVLAMVLAEAGQLPSLATNCPELGRRRALSDRTARNHLNTLRRNGLIGDYAWHGSNADFELWISPEILWPEDQKAAGKPAPQISEKTHISALLAGKRTDFPHIKSLVTHATKEKEISGVDKGGVAGPQRAGAKAAGDCDTTGHMLTGHTGPQPRPKRGKRGAPVPLEAGSHATITPGGGAAAKPAQSEVFKNYVVGFWIYAWKVLYPGWKFSEYEQKQAKNAIWSGVYRGFAHPFTDREWQQIHDEMLQRLDLAATYYQNHPDKHPPKPYAEFIKGAGYFDQENTRGFRATADWLSRKLVWQRQNRLEDALRKSRREISQHLKGTAPRRVQEKTPLQLFRHWETKIKPFGQPALERFYAQHAHNPHIHGFAGDRDISRKKTNASS